MIFLIAWLVMLLLGAAHHSLDAAVPALGYVTTLVLLVVLGLVSLVTPRPGRQ